MLSSIPSEIRWLYRQVRPSVGWQIASFFCITLASLSALLSPLILKWLIDVILPNRRTELLLVAVFLVFLCHQGKAVLATLGGYLTMLSAQRLALNLRLQLLRHLDSLSADYHEDTPVGTSMYPLKEPVDEISYFGSELLPSILRTLMATALTLGMMLVLNARMTLAVLPLIPVFLLTRKHFRSRLEGAADSVQQKEAIWNGFLQEHLSSISAVQLLRKEARQERMAFHLLGTSTRCLLGLFRTGVWFTFWTGLVVALATASIAAYGSWCVLTGTLTIGGLVAFYTYLAQLFDPLSGATEIYLRAQKTFASMRKIQAVFALRPSITNSAAPKKFPLNHWTIHLDDVCFAYPRNRGLLSISRLEILAGELVAIMGDNGAGKSTLAKLMARLYDVDSGTISIGSQDIRQIEIESLRENVTYSRPRRRSGEQHLIAHTALKAHIGQFHLPGSEDASRS